MLSSYCWKPAFKVFKAKNFQLCILYYYHYPKHCLTKVVYATVFVGTRRWFSPPSSTHSKAYSSHLFCGLPVTEHKLVLVEVSNNSAIATLHLQELKCPVLVHITLFRKKKIQLFSVLVIVLQGSILAVVKSTGV